MNTISLVATLFVSFQLACLSQESKATDTGTSKTSDAKATSAKLVTFTLQGTNYKFTLPKGFCQASGENAKWAEGVASLDSHNMTHFTIIPQAQDKPNETLTKWGMLKTPRGSLGKHIPSRDEMIVEMKSLIKNHESAELLGDARKLANKTFQDVFGKDAKMGMQMEFVDTDKNAAYLAGTGTFEIAGSKSTVACAGATTVAKGNVFFYYKYADYHKVSDIADLLKQVKAEISQFITDNPD